MGRHDEEQSARMQQRAVHIEMIGGLAGDMFLAAALDAGLVQVEDLSGALSQLGLGTIEVRVERVMRYGIEATHVSFWGWDASLERDHRHLSEIEEMIAASELSEAVKQRAVAMFYTLGQVEADTHNIPLSRVHFHEIGAIDSILDFVGAAYVIESSGVSRWSAGDVPRGEGVVEMSHGPMPAMAPATAKLLLGYTFEGRGVRSELVTPTGATLLKTLCDPTPVGPGRGALRSVGFGAGSKDFERFANVVRLSVYELSDVSADAPFDIERITRMEAELDDASPEVMAHATARLLEAGALDVTQQAVTMKKGRLGVRLTVLCRPQEAERLGGLVFELTSTFGLRVEEVQRWALRRACETVTTPHGEVRIKIGFFGDRIVTASPEYEDCATLAGQTGVSVQRVMDAARAAYAAQRGA